MDNHRLTEAKIGSATVVVDILPKGKVIPNTKIVPKTITVHNTGNVGAPAKNNHNYMKNCNKNGDRIASWHITVDDTHIYQAQSTNYKCYHAGNAKGNNESIGIEICMFNDKERQRKCYENAIALIKILLKYYGWGIDKVVRHKDYSGKHCPSWLIEGKFGYTWDWFKQQLKGDVAPQPPTNENTNNFIVKIICDELNIRKGPGTNYDKVGVVKKGGAYTIVEVNNNWGRLKSGVGWISIHSKYVQRL